MESTGYWDGHPSNYADDHKAFVVVSERNGRHLESGAVKDPEFFTIPDLEVTYARFGRSKSRDKDGDYGIDASQPHLLLLVAWWDSKRDKDTDQKQVDGILLTKAARTPGKLRNGEESESVEWRAILARGLE